MERHKSKVEADLERKINQLGEEEPRRLVLERTRAFKSSWVEMGRVLSQLAKTEEYKSWGYKSLTEYCQKELHIREATVLKLVGNFRFLSSQEPRMLERDNLVRLPEPEALKVLVDAKENNQLDPEAWDKLKEEAIEHGYAPTTLKRKLREARPGSETQKSEPAPSELKQRVLTLITSIRLMLEKIQNAPKTVSEALSCLETFAKESDERDQA